MRTCSVKAIKLVGGKIQIMNNYCIGCGYCMEICPQHCKTYRSDIDKVKDMVKRGENVFLSLDPSYPGIFDYNAPGQLVSAIYQLGFYQVRETAEGAEYVTSEYYRLLQEGKMDNIITTSCSSVVTLIEKHYPSLIPFMAPVVSPMIAHAKLIKKVKGNDVKVVYAGPCLSRSVEELDFEGAVDGVISFAELEEWMLEKSIFIKSCEERPFDNPDPMINQLYPVCGGIIRCVEAKGGTDKYQKLAVSGVHNCRELLHSMKKGFVHHTFVELDVCSGGCMDGPLIDKSRGFRFKATLDVERSARKENPPIRHAIPGTELETHFESHQISEPLPNKEELQELMKIIGNIANTPNLDCGACGYDTCEEKAIAMYRGKAEKTMCLMYSYEMARSMSNLVLSSTPNIIMVIDSRLHVLEFNRRAEEIFKTSKNEALSLYLFDFIDSSDFEEVLRTHKDVMRAKKVWKNYDMTVLETIIYIEETGCVLTIIEDVTEDEKEREKMIEHRIGTVEIAQSVIDKQMRTAQEIAGLLGETTAETKAILTQLKGYLLDGEEM